MKCLLTRSSIHEIENELDAASKGPEAKASYDNHPCGRRVSLSEKIKLRTAAQYLENDLRNKLATTKTDLEAGKEAMDEVTAKLNLAQDVYDTDLAEFRITFGILNPLGARSQWWNDTVDSPATSAGSQGLVNEALNCLAEPCPCGGQATPSRGAVFELVKCVETLSRCRREDQESFEREREEMKPSVDNGNSVRDRLMYQERKEAIANCDRAAHKGDAIADAIRILRHPVKGDDFKTVSPFHPYPVRSLEKVTELKLY